MIEKIWGVPSNFYFRSAPPVQPLISSPDLLKKTQPVAAFNVLEGAVCSCLPRPTRLWHSEPFRGRRDSALVALVASEVGVVSITHLAEASRHRATWRRSQFLQAFQPLCGHR